MQDEWKGHTSSKGLSVQLLLVHGVPPHYLLPRVPRRHTASRAGHSPASGPAQGRGPPQMKEACEEFPPPHCAPRHTLHHSPTLPSARQHEGPACPRLLQQPWRPRTTALTGLLCQAQPYKRVLLSSWTGSARLSLTQDVGAWGSILNVSSEPQHGH